MFSINDYIIIGTGDSRNPDEIISETRCMHTNSIETYIKFDGIWYRSHRKSQIELASYFDDAKTYEDCKWIIETLIKEGKIY